MKQLTYQISRLRERRGRLASILGISDWQIGRKIQQANLELNRENNVDYGKLL